MTKILITGCGQDARHLVELLRNYDVTVGARYCSQRDWTGFESVRKINLDITDASGVHSLFSTENFDEVYNTAAQSHVHESFVSPAATFQTNSEGVLNLLEAIRLHSPKTKFLTCSTSEMFGSNVDPDGFQRETTPFQANSPYAVSKIAAHQLVELYRKSYGLFACSSICFNHEGPYRTPTFLTRKVTNYVAKLSLGLVKTKLKLGNLAAYRDWSYAGDIVEAMRLMLDASNPKDYVVASGEAHTVEDFVRTAFSEIGIPNWNDYVEVDRALLRPCEVPMLRGDSSKIRSELGWTSRVNFNDLIKIMVNYDISYFSGY